MAKGHTLVALAPKEVRVIVDDQGPCLNDLSPRMMPLALRGARGVVDGLRPCLSVLGP